MLQKEAECKRQLMTKTGQEGENNVNVPRSAVSYDFMGDI